MRSKERLDYFYNTLKEIHQKYVQDWRFGQFILNFNTWHLAKYKLDIFYIEESACIDRIIEFLEDYGIKKEDNNE